MNCGRTRLRRWRGAISWPASSTAMLPRRIAANAGPRPQPTNFEPPVAPYCVLHAGASTPLKQWPAERWRELGAWLAEREWPVVLSAGRGEALLLEEIDPERRWRRFDGTLSLAQLWHLLARAALVVCPDTGVAHLARLTGAPTVALFGPGSALLSGAGEFWRDSPFTALTIPDFPCRDQRITMKRDVAWIRRCERAPGNAPGRCPDPRCMRALSTAMVRAAVAARLGLTTA